MRFVVVARRGVPQPSFPGGRNTIMTDSGWLRPATSLHRSRVLVGAATPDCWPGRIRVRMRLSSPWRVAVKSPRRSLNPSGAPVYLENLMTTYNTNEFRAGLKIMLDGDPYNIVENEFVKPGKGQAFNRARVRNLKTGRTIERTFRSGDSVEAADVYETDVQYLYNDGEFWHFMNPESYEQYSCSGDALGDGAKWLKEQAVCQLMLHNGEPISVTPPNFVELRIVETDPGVRGDTSGGGGKPATLETGAVVRVPLFVNVDEVIKVDTRSGEYAARVKD